MLLGLASVESLPAVLYCRIVPSLLRRTSKMQAYVTVIMDKNRKLLEARE